VAAAKRKHQQLRMFSNAVLAAIAASSNGRTESTVWQQTVLGKVSMSCMLKISLQQG
jgi:hypothetical protein